MGVIVAKRKRRKLLKIAKPEHLLIFDRSVLGFLKFYKNERLIDYVIQN